MLNDGESTITDVDVIICKQFFDQMNKVRLVFTRKNLGNLNLLDEFIQLLFFLLPFFKSQKIVNPLSSVGTQSINRIFALLLLFFLIIYRFISLSFYHLLFDSSFDLHGNLYILFSKFDHFFFNFWYEENIFCLRNLYWKIRQTSAFV